MLIVNRLDDSFARKRWKRTARKTKTPTRPMQTQFVEFIGGAAVSGTPFA